jgi:hypothetical protein
MTTGRKVSALVVVLAAAASFAWGMNQMVPGSKVRSRLDPKLGRPVPGVNHFRLKTTRDSNMTTRNTRG